MYLIDSLWQSKLLLDRFSLEDLILTDLKELEQLFSFSFRFSLGSLFVGLSIVSGRFLAFSLCLFCSLSLFFAFFPSLLFLLVRPLYHQKMCGKLLLQTAVVLLDFVGEDGRLRHEHHSDV